MSKYFTCDEYNTWYIFVLKRNDLEYKDDIKNWCKDNISFGNWIWNLFSDKIVFSIREPNKAMLFKLTWM